MKFQLSDPTREQAEVMTQWSHTSTGGSSNSVIPHVNRRQFWLSDPTRPPILATLETFGFASVSAQSYQIVCKNMISRYFSYFKNIRFRRDICSKLSNFIKQHDFSVLLLEGYCIANCFFTFFCKIIYFMKHQAKLGASNMKFHIFFSSGAIFQACGMIYVFLIYSKLLGLRSRKSMKSTKKSLFWIC